MKKIISILGSHHYLTTSVDVQPQPIVANLVLTRLQFLLMAQHRQVDQMSAQAYELKHNGAKQKSTLNVDKGDVYTALITISQALDCTSGCLDQMQKIGHWECEREKNDQLNGPIALPGGKIHGCFWPCEKIKATDDGNSPL